MPSLVRVQKCVATNCPQGNSERTFLQEKKIKQCPERKKKRLDFWESDWRRVGLGCGDSVRVLSSIVQ